MGPPMAKISLVGIWVETVLYGMSSVVLIVHRPSVLAYS